MKKTNYPSDLSDLEWKLFEPELRGSIKFGVFGRPPGHALREIVNGCLYLLKTGCQWRFLPRDFPPYNVVFYYFNRWRKSKILEKVNESLAKKVRVAAGRNEEPSVAIIDSQSAKTSEQRGVKGYDAGKKVKGRKRHIVTDYLGLLISVVVHSADIQDRDGAKILLEPLEFSRPRIEKIIGDGGYAGEALADWIYELRDDEHENQIELEIVKRSDLSQGFELLPHRWIVERTLSWLAKNRRLSKDYEIFTTTSEALIQLAMIKIMLKRLAT